MLWDCPKTAIDATANGANSVDTDVSNFLTNPQSWKAEEAFWTGVVNDLLLTIQSTGATGLNGQTVNPVQISNSATCPGNDYYTAGQWSGIALLGIAGATEIAAEEGAADAFAEAANGGPNAGFLRNYLDRPANQLQRGVNSLQRQIDSHLAKIVDPANAIGNWDTLSPQEQAGIISKWQGDIVRQRAQQSILQDLLNGRTP
jgi:hypothetical protein